MKFSELCKFTDKQWEATATADEKKYMLYGGARGGGKSYWLRWYLLRRILEYRAQGINIDVMLACEDYPSLTGRQVGKISTEFPLEIGSVKSTKEKGLGFHLNGGGSILLRNLDDASKYQSFEFAIIAIDEITKNPLSTFNKLRGSLRWPGVANTQFIGTCNPEACWVRDYWIEKRLPEELQSEIDNFAFVPAMPQDNPHLDGSYWRELNTLSGALRQAWLHGDWYAGIEGLVYSDFNGDNVTDIEPDKESPFEIAIDDGYIDPRATLFIQRLPGGDILVFDEIYHSKALEEETITEIQRKIERYGFGRMPTSASVSHEAIALRRRLVEAGIPAHNWMATRAGGGKSTRQAAITLTRSLICDGNKHRAIKVHRRCTNLLNEIRGTYKYPEGKHGLEAEPQDGGDHACQALESWVWHRQSNADPASLIGFA